MKTRILLLMILIFTAFAVVKADGVFIPPPNYQHDLYEPNQRAIIKYNAGVETLVLQAKYQGSNVTEFIWIVPVPNLPNVTEGNAMLYQTLSQITAPQVKRSTKINFFGGTMATAESKQVSREDYLVDLISRQQVGIYDVSILTARKAQTMIDWFNSRGYSLKQQALPMVENYLESDWYFVAIRVNVTKYSAGHYGELPPLQFKFNSSNIVYPMKISSLNPGDTEVLAYVLADRKVKPVFARSECYGVDPTRIKLDWNQTFKELSAEELAKPRPDYIAGCSLFVPGKTYYKLEYAGKVGPGLDGFAEKEYFLTKVRMKFNESNPIKSDIVFVNYGDNKTFRMIVDERGNEIKESRLQMLWDALIMLFQRR